ncbi:MAG TPA: 4Fe-4S binding protein [Bacillota bacterium]|nr:4Fe-4S binding protein [Bacillota bacterium]
MNVAVLSAKGGTGKTLVSVNLASVAANATYIDCDVEEPNGHLFLKPKNVTICEVSVPIPIIDVQLCNQCRACVEFCRFNALALTGNRIRVFENICHSCGGCMLVCPQAAISERYRPIGNMQVGVSEDVRVISGFLEPGEASGIPIIHRLLRQSEDVAGDITIIDCPPGSACIVMESVKGADYCVLVAEPTIYGVHNLDLVHQLVTLFRKPCGVVLNKCQEGDNPAERYCLEHGLTVLGRIPFDHELGRLNSDAKIATCEDPQYHALFTGFLRRIEEEVAHAAATCP